MLASMITPPDALVHLLKPWTDFYSHSKADADGRDLSARRRAAPRRRTRRSPPIARRCARSAAAVHERPHHLRELDAVHRWVITGLGDRHGERRRAARLRHRDLFGLGIFWTKMVSGVALLVNGLVMTRAEEALRRDASETPPRWRTLHRVAVTSLDAVVRDAALGVALVNFS